MKAEPSPSLPPISSHVITEKTAAEKRVGWTGSHLPAGAGSLGLRESPIRVGWGLLWRKQRERG